jgi:isochorismate pyruvate lyase
MIRRAPSSQLSAPRRVRYNAEMPDPDGCQSLAEVRSEIDRIDEQIIALLGRRAGYVHAAARFKTSEAAVAAPERQAAMLEERRRWATREGLDPDVIEKLYRDLVDYFIARELEHWKRL